MKIDSGINSIFLSSTNKPFLTLSDRKAALRIYFKNRLMIKKHFPMEPSDLHIYDDTLYNTWAEEQGYFGDFVYVNVSATSLSSNFQNSSDPISHLKESNQKS